MKMLEVVTSYVLSTVLRERLGVKTAVNRA